LIPALAACAASSPQQAADRINRHIAAGRLPQARFQVEYLASTSGWTPGLHQTAAQLAQQMNDPTRAAAHIEAALALSPNNPVLLRALAEDAITLQRWPLAADTLRALAAVQPDDAWAFFHLGLILAAFDPAQAQAALDRASSQPLHAADVSALQPYLSGHDASAASAMQIGLKLAERELWPYAELAFTHAADLAPPFPEALAYAGFARDQQGKDGGSLIHQAAALAPGSAPVQFLLGLHQRAQGDSAGSLNTLRTAAQLDPLNPAYAAEVAEGFRQLGLPDEAETWLIRAVTLSNNDSRFVALLEAFYAQPFER
jgi:tetratricopeptide (TPR) repeat protein